MDDFILEIPNNISSEICDDMICRFDKDGRKARGITLAESLDLSQNYKKSTDLNISGLDDWKDIDGYLYDKLKDGLEKYNSQMNKIIGNHSCLFHNTKDTGYQIQETKPGEYYAWHSDSSIERGRVLTFIWYLNTLDIMEDGGGTLFYGGKVITPEKGKLLIFPATWTYLHSGLPVVGNKSKYICTGWICSNMS